MLLRSLLRRRIRRLSAQTSVGGAPATGEDGGKDWSEMKLECKVKLSRRPRKPAAKSLLAAWAERWSDVGVVVDWEKPLPPKEFIVLPRLWVVERTFVLISYNRKMSLGLRKSQIPYWRPAVG